MNQNELNELNTRFENETPQEILRWAIQTYKPHVILSSSFGAESAGLLHMATQIQPDIPVVFIDTGFLFKETLEFKDELKQKLKLNLKEFKADPAQVASVQKNLNDPNNVMGKCCDHVKVKLMEQALVGTKCWIAGLRRHQSSTRKTIKIVESYDGGLIKVHPIANWSSKDTFGYITQNNLPFHPLWHKGYTSIGCEPCTRLPLPGEDERSGRWAGQDKTECGIHTFMSEDVKEKD